MQNSAIGDYLLDQEKTEARQTALRDQKPVSSWMEDEVLASLMEWQPVDQQEETTTGHTQEAVPVATKDWQEDMLRDIEDIIAQEMTPAANETANLNFSFLEQQTTTKQECQEILRLPAVLAGETTGKGWVFFFNSVQSSRNVLQNFQ